MAPLAGTYQFESQDNYLEYLKGLGVGKELLNDIANKDNKLVIGPIEADKVNVAFGEVKLEFTLNKELEYDLSGGHKKKATVTLNGDSLTIKTKLADDGSFTEEKILKATDSGLVVTVSNSAGAKAERRYKRV